MRKIISFLLIIIATFCFYGCDARPQNSSSNKNPNQTDELLELQLNHANAPSEQAGNFSYTVENVEFLYNNSFSNDYAHIEMQKAGFITNLTPFGELERVTINYDTIQAEIEQEQNLLGFGYIKYRVSDNFIDNPNDYGTNVTMTSTNYTIDLSKTTGDNFISFWTPRSVKINSLTFVYSNKEYQPSYEDFNIQIISTNDLHGQVNQTSQYPGLAKLSNKINEITGEGDQFNILLDQGDIYQGTAESGLSNGFIMDDFLLANGYESTTLGNHEFDWGESRIIEHYDYSAVTILANNVRYTSTNQSPDWATPYKLISRNGVKIGVIGALGNVYSSISGSKVTGLKFLSGSALTEQIKQDSLALKEMGADFIILSIHDGDQPNSNKVSYLSYYDVEKLSGTYVDLVLEGHSHQRYRFYDSKGVWHVQNGGNGSSFFVTTLKCEYGKNGYTVSTSTQDVPIYYTTQQSVEAGNNKTMLSITNWYESYEYGAKQSEIIGKNVPYMSSKNFTNQVAKLYYEYGVSLAEKTGITPVLGGGSINTRTPYNLSSGTVTYGDVYNLLPFENDLVICSITGKNLLNRFINNSDYRVYYTINPNQIVSNNTYYIITDTWNSDYSLNKLTVVKNLTITYHNFYARDLMAEYLKNTYL